MCIGVFAYMCVCERVSDSQKLKCWELNPGPLEEQPVLLAVEPSLQTPASCILDPWLAIVLWDRLTWLPCRLT